MSKRFQKAASNYLATMGFLVGGYLFYTTAARFVRFFSGTHAFPTGFGETFSFSTPEAFRFLIWTYALVLVPYYFFGKETSSARIFLSGCLKKIARDESWKLAGRSLALKFFFAPLMIHWLISHAAGMVQGYERTFVLGSFSGASLSEMPFFVFAFQAILFADVFFFTAGYLLESGYLKNRIVSIDPTASGWIVCLLCYPPFNAGTEGFFGWFASDNPFLPNQPALTAVLNVSILVLMGVYAWASVALGWKASNLTNRGVVERGPYRFVRHPAYVTKNLAWWIGSIPALLAMNGF